MTEPRETAAQADAQADAPSLLTEPVAHLVALAAAVASNAERAFQTQHYRLTQLGVSKEDMIQAVNIALRVKGDPHQAIVEMAEAYLVGKDKGGCCCGEGEEGCGCEESGEGCCCGDEGCGCH